MPRLPQQAEALRRLLVTALAAALLSGCGGGSHHGQAAARATAPGDPPTLPLADCDQWREMRESTRHGFVTQMNLFFGAKADNGQAGQTLTDAQAFRVLSAGCRPRWAGAIKLYKLYGRAAAFTP